MDVQEYVQKHKQIYQDNHALFRCVFGTSLTSFWSMFHGLDVVAFDEFIAPDENESTYAAVARKYGEDAVVLVNRLLS